MPIPQEALDLENRNLGANGEPTLAKAWDILKEQWDNGDRDRELGLHLMFISWYGIIEPTHITGFPTTIESDAKLNQVLDSVHEFFEPAIKDDAEMLYTVGLPAQMFWYMFSNPEKWERIAAEYRALYRHLEPNGINPKVFEGRGAYGEYYAMQSAGEGGY